MAQRPQKKPAVSARKQPVHPLVVALVSLCFLWHTLAIGVTAIPLHAMDPIARGLRTYVRPIITPYVFATAAWQDWRVYIVPSPLQFEKRFAVDIVRRGRVIRSLLLGADRSRTIEANIEGAKQEFLQQVCTQSDVEPSDEARLTQRWYLDRTDPPLDRALLDRPNAGVNRSLEWYEYTYAQVQCGSLPTQ